MIACDSGTNCVIVWQTENGNQMKHQVGEINLNIKSSILRLKNHLDFFILCYFT